MGASIFDSVLSHTRRSDASEKREENSVSTFGRFRLWTSFESSPVSVKRRKNKNQILCSVKVQGLVLLTGIIFLVTQQSIVYTLRTVDCMLGAISFRRFHV